MVGAQHCADGLPSRQQLFSGHLTGATTADGTGTAATGNCFHGSNLQLGNVILLHYAGSHGIGNFLAAPKTPWTGQWKGEEEVGYPDLLRVNEQ